MKVILKRTTLFLEGAPNPVNTDVNQSLGDAETDTQVARKIKNFMQRNSAILSGTVYTKDENELEINAANIRMVLKIDECKDEKQLQGILNLTNNLG